MRVSEVRCRTILTRTGGFLAGFTHSLNPYRGCSLGGTLCGLPDYAPGIAAGWGETRPWGSYLDVKINAPEAYDTDHDRIRRGPRPRLRIFMSSVTDPYVPQEKRYRISRRILERMRDRPPDSLVIQTHTPNPVWDENLLVDLSGLFPLVLQISVETDREDLGPGFRPHAYPVADRLRALESFRRRGVETVGVVAPLWPLEDVEGFARRLDEACSYVVVDHYLLGDGSAGGARTCSRQVAPGVTFPDMLRRAGYEEWTTLERFDEVVAVFRRILGEPRVGVSRQGFASAPRRAAGM